MTRGTCATCAFFEDVRQECRFNPPTVVAIAPTQNPTQNAATDSRWPAVDSDDWCSHWMSAFVEGRRKTYARQLNDGDVQILSSTQEERIGV